MTALYWTIKQEYNPWIEEKLFKCTPQVSGTFTLKKGNI